MSTLPKKKTLDLAALNICPELGQYIPRISLRQSALDLYACIRISKSSANRRCDTIGASLHTFIPSKSPLSSTCCIKHERPSATIKNK
jgi:hypothetical protein